MSKKDEIWSKQFGEDILETFDFSGKKIRKEFFKNINSLYGWDIFKIENDEYIVVNLLTLDRMPKNWENNFIINDNEYKFLKKNNGIFEIFLLKNEEEKNEEKSNVSIKEKKLTSHKNNFISSNNKNNLLSKLSQVDKKNQIVNQEKLDNFFTSSKIIKKEVEQYFPYTWNENLITLFKFPDYISLVINFSNFPIIELKIIRMMLQKKLKKMDIFQDIFIYSSENENINLKYSNNCYMRIFFKSNNCWAKNIKIFKTSLIIKNILNIVIKNVKNIYKLSDVTSFTMFLSNHKKNYKYISWITNYEIDTLIKRPIRINKGELIVDEIYFQLLINLEKYYNSFIILKSGIGDTYFLFK